MRRIGVDVGGTFTDLIYIDDEAGRGDRPQDAVDARRSLDRNGPGHQRAVRDGRHRARAARPGLPRHDGRDEHRDRAQRRQGRDDHDQGLSRHPAHRAAQEADELLALAEPAVAGEPDRAAPLPADRRRADRQERRRPHPARRRRGARAGAPAEGGEGRGGLRLPAVLVPQSRARAARRRDRARGVPRGVPLGLERGHPAVPRVRALLDRRPERLRRAQGLELHRPLRRGPAQDEASGRAST